MVTNTPSKYEGHINIELDFKKKGAPKYLSDVLKAAQERGFNSVKLRVKEGTNVCYPNICVPVAGVIAYYREVYGFNFIPSKSWINSGILAHSGTIDPFEFDKLSPPSSFLNKVWRFSHDTYYEIVSGIIESLRRSGEMGKDILHGVELALNEVMDNTLQHSIPLKSKEEPIGYVMAQHHKAEEQIVVAVYDAGQGIASSLREGGISVQGSEDSLRKALQRGVTSGNGAGNGLWMMESIVLASSGSFKLASDGALYSLRKLQNNDVKSVMSKIRQYKSGTTLVDFQINCTKDISLESTLESTPTDLWAEERLLDDGSGVKISLIEEARGYGSRKDGKQFSNMVINLLKAEPGKCILDFNGISIIGASFADELIFNLIEALTFVGFTNRVIFIGLSPACATVINECFKTRTYRS